MSEDEKLVVRSPRDWRVAYCQENRRQCEMEFARRAVMRGETAVKVGKDGTCVELKPEDFTPPTPMIEALCNALEDQKKQINEYKNKKKERE